MKYTPEVIEYERQTKAATLQRDKRCVLCRALPVQVHEIIPRSHFGVKSMERCFDIKNRICLCPNCHQDAANPESRRKLLAYLEQTFWYDYSEDWFRRYVNTD